MRLQNELDQASLDHKKMCLSVCVPAATQDTCDYLLVTSCNNYIPLMCNFVFYIALVDIKPGNSTCHPFVISKQSKLVSGSTFEVARNWMGQSRYLLDHSPCIAHSVQLGFPSFPSLALATSICSAINQTSLIIEIAYSF